MGSTADLHRESFRVIEQKDLTKLRELLHPNYSYTSSDGVTQPGPDAGIAVAEKYINAFPDLKLDVQNQYSPSDDVSIIEFIGTGTHQGELEGIAPTGKKVHVPVCSIIEARDGKIYREREYFDNMVLMQQLGVAAMPSQTQYGTAGGMQ